MRRPVAAEQARRCSVPTIDRGTAPRAPTQGGSMDLHCAHATTCRHLPNRVRVTQMSRNARGLVCAAPLRERRSWYRPAHPGEHLPRAEGSPRTCGTTWSPHADFAEPWAASACRSWPLSDHVQGVIASGRLRGVLSGVHCARGCRPPIGRLIADRVRRRRRDHAGERRYQAPWTPVSPAAQRPQRASQTGIQAPRRQAAGPPDSRMIARGGRFLRRRQPRQALGTCSRDSWIPAVMTSAGAHPAIGVRAPSRSRTTG